MSSIEEVRVADNRVKNTLDALRKVDKQDQTLQDRLNAELKSATDEYARAVRELKSNSTALRAIPLE